MMLYLTGATSSVKSGEVAQSDVSKSLGGYISSTPVPNGYLNTLFDTISMRTLKDRQKETICIGLVNGLSQSVANVMVKIVSEKENICRFKIAAVLADKNLCVEHIPNRYSEPINAEFYDANFNRASVDVEILTAGIIGESISFEPFDVIATVESDGFDGTWDAIHKAFYNDETYSVKRLTETKFRIERKDEKVVEKPIVCSYLSTDNCKLNFLSDFQNAVNNEVLITENLAAGSGIGIWLQREIPEFVEKTDDEILSDYNNKKQEDETESVELVIDYDLTYDENRKDVIDGGKADSTFVNSVDYDCGKS